MNSTADIPPPEFCEGAKFFSWKECKDSFIKWTKSSPEAMNYKMTIAWSKPLKNFCEKKKTVDLTAKGWPAELLYKSITYKCAQTTSRKHPRGDPYTPIGNCPARITVVGVEKSYLLIKEINSKHNHPPVSMPIATDSRKIIQSSLSTVAGSAISNVNEKVKKCATVQEESAPMPTTSHTKTRMEKALGEAGNIGSDSDEEGITVSGDEDSFIIKQAEKIERQMKKNNFLPSATVAAGITAAEKTIVVPSEGDGSVQERVKSSGHVKIAPRPAQKSVEVPAGITAVEKAAIVSSEGDGSVQERAESSGNVIIAPRPAQKPVEVPAGIVAAEKTIVASSEEGGSVHGRVEASGNVKNAPRPAPRLGKMPAGITAAEKTAIVSSEGDGSVQERVKSSGHVKIAPRPAQKSVEVPAGITAAEKTAIVLSEGDDSVQERAEASGNVKNAPRPAPRLGKMPDGITAAEKTIGVPSEGDGSVQKRVESSGHVKIAPRPAQKPVEVPAGIVASEKTIVASSEEGGSVHGRVEASGNVKNAPRPAPRLGKMPDGITSAEKTIGVPSEGDGSVQERAESSGNVIIAPRPAQKSVEVPAGIVAAEKTIVASSEGDGSVQERAESSGNVIIASRPAQKPVEVPAGIVAAEKTIVASSEEGGSVHGRVEAAENVKKAPKTIVAKFNEKTQNEQINLLLEWLKIPNVVNIMEGLAKLKESDIKHLDAYTLSDALLSDEVNITCLQKYCTAGALRAIKKYIKQKNKINEWHCGQCSNTIETAMIMCDSCLLWQHYDCVNLKEGEEIDGEWYCPRCLFNI